MQIPFQAETARDRINTRIIQASRRSVLGIGLRDPQCLLDVGSADERAEYARHIKRRLVYGIGIIAFVSVSMALRTPAEPVNATATYTDAGSVLGVELHETSFSRTSSVTTSTGTFQVSGAVTAAIGDGARFKQAADSIGKSLCIGNAYKAHCYRLL